VLRSTQPPIHSEMGNEQYLTWRGLWGETLVWLIGAVVCLLAALWVQLSIAQAMDGRIMCCGIISSCQSAATLSTVKRYCS